MKIMVKLHNIKISKKNLKFLVWSIIICFKSIVIDAILFTKSSLNLFLEPTSTEQRGYSFFFKETIVTLILFNLIPDNLFSAKRSPPKNRTIKWKHVLCLTIRNNPWVLYTNIDQTLVNSLHGLLNRWIRLACYYNRVKNTCPLYTHVTPIV